MSMAVWVLGLMETTFICRSKKGERVDASKNISFAIWCLCWRNLMFFFQEHLAACSPCDCCEPCGSFD